MKFKSNCFLTPENMTEYHPLNYICRVGLLLLLVIIVVITEIPLPINTYDLNLFQVLTLVFALANFGAAIVAALKLPPSVQVGTWCDIVKVSRDGGNLMICLSGLCLSLLVLLSKSVYVISTMDKTQALIQVLIFAELVIQPLLFVYCFVSKHRGADILNYVFMMVYITVVLILHTLLELKLSTITNTNPVAHIYYWIPLACEFFFWLLFHLAQISLQCPTLDTTDALPKYILSFLSQLSLFLCMALVTMLQCSRLDSQMYILSAQTSIGGPGSPLA